uniref:Uncharacterized protein n=1 Tax=Steinernema glaseri TaxID=37863 RepID=A0A1I7Z1T8_9BILA
MVPTPQRRDLILTGEEFQFPKDQAPGITVFSQDRVRRCGLADHASERGGHLSKEPKMARGVPATDSTISNFAEDVRGRLGDAVGRVSHFFSKQFKPLLHLQGTATTSSSVRVDNLRGPSRRTFRAGKETVQEANTSFTETISSTFIKRNSIPPRNGHSPRDRIKTLEDRSPEVIRAILQFGGSHPQLHEQSTEIVSHLNPTTPVGRRPRHLTVLQWPGQVWSRAPYAVNRPKDINSEISPVLLWKLESTAASSSPLLY